MKKLVLLLTLLISFSLYAQVDLGYQKPIKAILDLVDVPLPPRMSMNSKGDQALLTYRNSFKSIEELSQKELRLAGLRINPKTNIGSRTRFLNKISLLDVESKTEKEIEGLPDDVQISYVRWSPDESKIAFSISQNESTKLWVLDAKTASAAPLSDISLNANMGSPYSWTKDSKSLIVKALPDERMDLIDKSSTIPTGPTISENFGKKAQNRTYQDLLKDKTDEQNFTTLASSELVKVDMDGNKSSWLPEAIYRSISSSPDGKYYLITTVEKPFSYLVPYSRFPSKTSIYSSDGDLVKVLLEVPLIEDLPKGFDAVRLGMRSVQWRDDKPATIVWVEALDGGDPKMDVDFRDAVFQQNAPFTGPKSKLIETKNRFRYIQWCDDNTAIAHDRAFNDRNVKSYLFSPSDPSGEITTIQDRNYQDSYSDPGSFVTEKNEFGEYTIAKNDGKLYLIGDGYSDDGILPFIDQFDLESKETKRIYKARKNNKLEKIIDAIDLKEGKFLTSIESNNDYPNYYIRDINSRGKLTEVTNFENPFESIKDVHKEVINYKRDDGLDLSGTLYLPSGYDKSSGEKLPMILWAYPVEYKDKSSAAQITSSPYAFTYPSYGSPIFWVTRGYAVLARAAFPIIGEGDEEPNDSFRKQLVANGRAAIDAVDALGYIDRDRVGVGGHSYGAFMVANLLSHSNDYAAGIARSGAYNRTLTPFGFQREQRSYWEAPEVYYTMSPFMHADKMKTPLLLVHGEADNNSGTYPMQSERYFNALKGLGATARLVMLPKESHGYSAKESVLHMLWEQDQWLEKYVKNKPEKKINKP
jgi:dipeptidyl aminopeptidase/acylaminoacyl peptidase